MNSTVSDARRVRRLPLRLVQRASLTVEFILQPRLVGFELRHHVAQLRRVRGSRAVVPVELKVAVTVELAR